MTEEADSTATASEQRTPTDNGGFRPQVLREHTLIGGRGEYTVTPTDSGNVWGGSYRLTVAGTSR